MGCGQQSTQGPGSDYLNSAPSSTKYLIMLSLGFLIYKKGTIIGPTSLGIAKIHNRDNSYKTLTLSLLCNELK